jgi:cell wall assembly regulator SMI1
LTRLDHWLKTHRHRYHHGLLPGATPAELDALQAALGRPLPEELRTWLTWHNGQDPDVPGGLEENWIPMGTTDIAEVKKELDAEAHAGWHKEWIPFLDNDNDSFLCLDPTQPGCAVRECWKGKEDHPVAAPSLAAWVEHVVTGLEQGKYTEDPERGSMHRR